MINNFKFGDDEVWGDESNQDNYANQHNPNHEATNN